MWRKAWNVVKNLKSRKMQYVPFIALIILFVCYIPLSPVFIWILLNYAFFTAEKLSSCGFEKAFTIWKKLQTSPWTMFLFCTLQHSSSIVSVMSLCFPIYVHFMYTYIFSYKIFSLIVAENVQGVDDLSKSDCTTSPSLASLCS